MPFKYKVGDKVYVRYFPESNSYKEYTKGVIKEAFRKNIWGGGEQNFYIVSFNRYCCLIFENNNLQNIPVGASFILEDYLILVPKEAKKPISKWKEVDWNV